MKQHRAKMAHFYGRPQKSGKNQAAECSCFATGGQTLYLLPLQGEGRDGDGFRWTRALETHPHPNRRLGFAQPSRFSGVERCSTKFRLNPLEGEGTQWTVVRGTNQFRLNPLEGVGAPPRCYSLSQERPC